MKSISSALEEESQYILDTAFDKESQCIQNTADVYRYIKNMKVSNSLYLSISFVTVIK